MTLVRIYEIRAFRTGTYGNKSAQKAHLLKKEREIRQNTYASRIVRTSQMVPVLPTCIIVGGKWDTYINLSSRRLFSPCRPRRSIRTHARHLVYFRVLTKHEDLPPPCADMLRGICGQSALNATDNCKNDVCASLVRLYEYARELAKMLENGADVGFDSVWW